MHDVRDVPIRKYTGGAIGHGQAEEDELSYYLSLTPEQRINIFLQLNYDPHAPR